MKKLLAVGSAVLVLALGVVGVASAHSPSEQGLFTTPYASSQSTFNQAFRIDTGDVQARTGADNGTPVLRVYTNPYAHSELDAVLSVSGDKVYKGAYLNEDNKIFDLVGNMVTRARVGGSPSTDPANVVYLIQGDTIYRGAYANFDQIAYRFDEHTLYRGAYKNFDAIVFTSDAPLQGNLARILGILADGAF